MAVRRGLRRLLAMAGFAASALMLVTSDSAHADNAVAIAERHIKAAFLSKFVEYVEWPEAAFSRSDPRFKIAVLGDDALVADLRGILASQPIEGRTFEVLVLHDGEPANGVQLLFVAKAKRRLLGSTVAAPDQPILVVAESNDALAYGATINFVVIDSHVGFEVSMVDAERRQLKLGSRLLSVARNIRRS